MSDEILADVENGWGKSRIVNLELFFHKWYNMYSELRREENLST